MRQGKGRLHNYLCYLSVMLWSAETTLQIKNNALHIAIPDQTLELSALANRHCFGSSPLQTQSQV